MESIARQNRKQIPSPMLTDQLPGVVGISFDPTLSDESFDYDMRAVAALVTKALRPTDNNFSL